MIQSVHPADIRRERRPCCWAAHLAAMSPSYGGCRITARMMCLSVNVQMLSTEKRLRLAVLGQMNITASR